MNLVTDICRAIAQMRDPRFIGVFLRAIVITLAGLILVTVAVVTALGWLLPDSIDLPWIGQIGFVDDVVSWAAVAAMLVLSVVMMLPTAAAVVGFFLEEIAAAVEDRFYPNLPPPLNVGFRQQSSDALRFFVLMVGANLAALLAYLLLPPFAPMIFWALNGLLLGREYFQLVAARHLGSVQADALRRRNSGRIWLAGTAMAIPLSVPLLNLVVPVLGVAVFTHQFQRIVSAESL